MSDNLRRAAVQCVVPLAFLPVMGTAYTDDLFEKISAENHPEGSGVQITLHMTGTREDVGHLVGYLFNACEECQFFFAVTEGDFQVIRPGIEDRLKVWRRKVNPDLVAKPSVRARVRKRQMPAEAM